MRMLFIAGLAFFIGAMSTAGQSSLVDQSKNDPKAKKILDELNAKYKSLSSIQAKISLIIKSPEEDLTDELKGTIYLKGKKYKLELGDQEVTCNNKHIWTYLKDVNEVQINIYEPEEGTITPQGIFTMYEAGYFYAFNGEIQEDGKVLQMIDLTPHDKSKSYFKIRLYVNKVKNEIVKTIIFDKNGNRYIYQIHEFVSNKNLPDSFFQFDTSKYPGIEVIDLR